MRSNAMLFAKSRTIHDAVQPQAVLLACADRGWADSPRDQFAVTRNSPDLGSVPLQCCRTAVLVTAFYSFLI